MVTLRWSKATLSSTLPKLRWANAIVQGTGTSPKLRVSNMLISGTAPVTLRPFADVLVEAYAPVTITAVPGATSPTPDGYSWRQISGPTVTFTDNGGSITFIAPPAWAGTTVVFGVTGYLSGSPSPEVTANTVVTPHLYWNAAGDGSWQARALPVSL